MRTVTVWGHSRAYEAITAFERENPKYVAIAADLTYADGGRKGTRKGYILPVVPRRSRAKVPR